MKLINIKETLNAKVLTGHDKLELEVKSAFGCDLLSDVLAFVKEETLLLTGLTNSQVIRTAEILDVYVIIFVRGKSPSNEVIQMAKERHIVLMSTNDILYTACGKLYEKGLRGIKVKGDKANEQS